MTTRDFSLVMGSVLFVCVENTFRSVMAEAIFNANAPPGWKAESAGVRPATEINPVAVELLREIGIEVGSKTPRLVTPEMVSSAWRVVTLRCMDSCPIGAADKGEDWPLHGATGKTMDELRGIRDEIRRRVVLLIEQTSRATTP